MRVSANKFKLSLRKESARWLVIFLTLFAAGLRGWRLNTGLWLDEIATVLLYRDLSALQILADFSTANNHLLNSILVTRSIAYWGESDWAVRLPAFFFGVLTVPAVYKVARLLLTRWGGLMVALLLAVSYPHIFFSQNARGYAAFLLFSLLSSWLLSRTFIRERRRYEWLYLAMMAFNFAANLTAAFIFAGHLLIGLAVILKARLRQGRWRRHHKRVVLLFGVCALVFPLIYALALPKMIQYMRSTYLDPAIGFNPFSIEFVLEITRSIGGIVPGPLLFVGLALVALIGSWGALTLFKKNWALTAMLILPMVLLAAYLIGRRQFVSPRFFLFTLFFMLITAVQGGQNIVRWLRKYSSAFATGLAVTVSITAVLLSLISLRAYYTYPKQAYESALTYLEESRQPDETVIILHNAEAGFRYYGEKIGIAPGEDYLFIRTEADFNQLLAQKPPQQLILVTTFHRALRITLPQIVGTLESEWQPVQRFPGTVGDGQINIWRLQ